MQVEFVFIYFLWLKSRFNKLRLAKGDQCSWKSKHEHEVRKSSLNYCWQLGWQHSINSRKRLSI